MPATLDQAFAADSQSYEIRNPNFISLQQMQQLQNKQTMPQYASQLMPQHPYYTHPHQQQQQQQQHQQQQYHPPHHQQHSCDHYLAHIIACVVCKERFLAQLAASGQTGGGNGSSSNNGGSGGYVDIVKNTLFGLFIIVVLHYLL